MASRYAYVQYLEHIDTLRQVARELGLECAEDIRVTVTRGGASPVRMRVADHE